MRPNAVLKVAGAMMLIGLGYGLSAQVGRAQIGNELVGIGPNVIQGRSYSAVAVAANGDVYGYFNGGWHFDSNVFGSTTPTERASLGQIRARWGGR